mmetsp:Transcript_17598/g.70676  ORF Transcript_17598/g.70676 Transcript_17598/m.70676 type:complete len:167 (+) Transcript_17598:654-1154(+)
MQRRARPVGGPDAGSTGRTTSRRRCLLMAPPHADDGFQALLDVTCSTTLPGECLASAFACDETVHLRVNSRAASLSAGVHGRATETTSPHSRSTWRVSSPRARERHTARKPTPLGSRHETLRKKKEHGRHLRVRGLEDRVDAPRRPPGRLDQGVAVLVPGFLVFLA